MPPINSGDTAWVLISTALVLVMTPALAFFYGGMVRRKNVLSTLNLSFITIALISVQWVLLGYSLAFGKGFGELLGGLNFVGLQGVGAAPNPDYAATIPHLAFAAFQMMFAIITPALITGAFVERVKFKTYLLFTLLWATLVYDPGRALGVGGGRVPAEFGRAGFRRRNRGPRAGRFLGAGVCDGDRRAQGIRKSANGAAQHSLHRAGRGALVDGLVRI